MTSSSKLWAGNLDETAEAGTVQSVFGRFGEVTKVVVKQAPGWPNNRFQFALVTFASPDGAQRAFQALQGLSVPGLTVAKKLKLKVQGGVHGGSGVPARGGSRPQWAAAGDEDDDVEPTPDELAGASRHLWLGNLHAAPSAEDIYELFIPFGDVDVSYIPGKLFAFVNYGNALSAARALKVLNGKHIPHITGSHMLVVDFSSSKYEGGGAGPRAEGGPYLGDDLEEEEPHVIYVPPGQSLPGAKRWGDYPDPDGPPPGFHTGPLGGAGGRGRGRGPPGHHPGGYGYGEPPLPRPGPHPHSPLGRPLHAAGGGGRGGGGWQSQQAQQEAQARQQYEARKQELARAAAEAQAQLADRKDIGSKLMQAMRVARRAEAVALHPATAAAGALERSSSPHTAGSAAGSEAGLAEERMAHGGPPSLEAAAVGSTAGTAGTAGAGASRAAAGAGAGAGPPPLGPQPSGRPGPTSPPPPGFHAAAEGSPSRHLLISNVGPQASQTKLFWACAKYGRIEGCMVLPTRGVAEVHYERAQAAQRMRAALNGKKVSGLSGSAPLVVTYTYSGSAEDDACMPGAGPDVYDKGKQDKGRRPGSAAGTAGGAEGGPGAAERAEGVPAAGSGSTAQQAQQQGAGGSESAPTAIALTRTRATPSPTKSPAKSPAKSLAKFPAKSPVKAMWMPKAASGEDKAGDGQGDSGVAQAGEGEVGATGQQEGSSGAGTAAAAAAAAAAGLEAQTVAVVAAGGGASDGPEVEGAAQGSGAEAAAAEAAVEDAGAQAQVEAQQAQQEALQQAQQEEAAGTLPSSMKGADQELGSTAAAKANTGEDAKEEEGTDSQGITRQRASASASAGPGTPLLPPPQPNAAALAIGSEEQAPLRPPSTASLESAGTRGSFGEPGQELGLDHEQGQEKETEQQYKGLSECGTSRGEVREQAGAGEVGGAGAGEGLKETAAGAAGTAGAALAAPETPAGAEQGAGAQGDARVDKEGGGGDLDTPCCACCDASGAEVKLRKCSACQAVSYCGFECQSQDWSASHHADCYQLQCLLQLLRAAPSEEHRQACAEVLLAALNAPASSLGRAVRCVATQSLGS